LAVTGVMPFAYGSAEEARSIVETIVDKAKTLDNKTTRAQNAKTIESLVDFRKLALDAMGSHSKSASPAQKTQVQELLRKIITKTVYPEAPRFFRDVKIEFKTSEEGAGNKAHVTSVITKGDRRSTVEYWLEPEGGQYRVVDLAVEGERWVENVHEQFDEIIKKNGVSGLIAKMKKRLSQLENKSS
jgi:phospholipid transport system substrate-binding protein